MPEEKIWHVDENDAPIGWQLRKDAKKKGNRYRIARVMVESSCGRYIALQKRLMSKGTFPGCWDTSAGGNIDYGESYEDAALRELEEEIGLKVDSLREVLYYYGEAADRDKKLNRFTKVYTVSVPLESVFTPQPTEVERIEWLAVRDLGKLVYEGEVTDGLRQVYERLYAAIESET